MWSRLGGPPDRAWGSGQQCGRGWRGPRSQGHGQAPVRVLEQWATTSPGPAALPRYSRPELPEPGFKLGSESQPRGFQNTDRRILGMGLPGFSGNVPPPHTDCRAQSHTTSITLGVMQHPSHSLWRPGRCLINIPGVQSHTHCIIVLLELRDLKEDQGLSPRVIDAETEAQ